MFLLVPDGTLRGNKWQNKAACAGIWELSCSLHVNQRRPDVLLHICCTSGLEQRFTDVASWPL